MILSLINLLIVGFLTGFIFSIPIAGPIALLVVTNSLKNRARFSNRVALGAAIIDFLYVFIAMFGITALIKYYQPFIPYLFILGGIVLLVVARKIFKTKFSLTSSEEELENDEEKGGFRTGLLINFTNPGVFFGWLTSSFLILSLAASLGLSTGGMEKIVGRNVTEVTEITKGSVPKLKKPPAVAEQLRDAPQQTKVEISPYKAATLSLAYAFGVGTGGYIWFFLFGGFIRKHRKKLHPSRLNIALKIFSFFIVGLSGYFFYMGLKVLF